jgi:hypothetical protein
MLAIGARAAVLLQPPTNHAITPVPITVKEANSTMSIGPDARTSARS